RGAGSSTAFRTALADFSFSRSASSTRMICQRPLAGAVNDLRTVSRMSLTRISLPTAATVVTSAWVPTRAVWQPSQKPQPGDPPRARSGLTHCSAAAKARAAWLRPAPGGPVNSQACVIFDASGRGSSAAAAVTIASASRAAASSCALTRSCPTRSSHTVIDPAASRSHPAAPHIRSALSIVGARTDSADHGDLRNTAGPGAVPGAAPASAPRRPAPGRQLGEGAKECRSAPPAPAPAPFVVLVVLVGAQEFVRQGRKVVQRGLLGP